jgi:rubrerythrin
MTMKGGLTAAEVKTPCPTCGHVAEGIRCPRCNAFKLVSCNGSCRTCKTKCG